LVGRGADENKLALLFAHVACELHTDYGLTRLTSKKSDTQVTQFVHAYLKGIIRTLANDRVSTAYKILTGQPGILDNLPWWNDWLVSRKTRNAVAHGAANVSEGEARKAIDLADQYIAHITAVVN
jgi:hypothetical protein